MTAPTVSPGDVFRDVTGRYPEEGFVRADRLVPGVAGPDIAFVTVVEPSTLTGGWAPGWAPVRPSGGGVLSVSELLDPQRFSRMGVAL